MTKIIFIDSEGTERAVDATDGDSVMEAAVRNGIPGILAECGGACACATCHVFVHPAFKDEVGEPGEMEAAMLEFAERRSDSSRLSCQIPVRPELEGLRVTTPEHQY